jgi:hypothetical protein
MRAARELKDSSNSGEPDSSTWRTLSAKSNRSHKVILWAGLSDQIGREVNQIGLANPLSIAWEVVPFSFVVDWGLPIGNVLEALTATRGLEFIGGCSIVRGEGTIEAELKPTGTNTVLTPRTVECEYFSARRTKYGTFPRPMPYAKSPFSTSNTLSALALYHSIFGGK